MHLGGTISQPKVIAENAADAGYLAHVALCFQAQSATCSGLCDTPTTRWDSGCIAVPLRYFASIGVAGKLPVCTLTNQQIDVIRELPVLPDRLAVQVNEQALLEADLDALGSLGVGHGYEENAPTEAGAKALNPESAGRIIEYGPGRSRCLAP